jgi:dienelactone hydrolase
MRRDIEFSAEGVTLRGWLYLPEGAAGPVPTVVMAHGLSAVKEMYLDRYAEVFADAGLGALVFDNRCLGASDGEPRQEVDPWLQVRDYRHAITYARTLPEVDRERIGVWGSSLSGGHALVVGAIDRRVKCVVSQVPVVSGYRNLLRQIRPDLLPQVRAGFDADREARFAGKPNDTAAVADQAFEAYERALPPKRLHILPGGHFDAYVSEFDLAATAARDWLVEHLGATGAREPS